MRRRSPEGIVKESPEKHPFEHGEKKHKIKLGKETDASGEYHKNKSLVATEKSEDKSFLKSTAGSNATHSSDRTDNSMDP